MKIKTILENNNKWMQRKLLEDPNYFTNLSKGQKPEVLYIGCSDSRVVGEEFMGAKPGDIFVHRNIANMVPNADMNILSVINYAVVHLKVKQIIVCGHYFCGGVKAAMEFKDLGVLNPWLKNIRDVYYLHKKELDEIKDYTLRFHRFVELNVLEQCFNIFKIAEVQQAYQNKNLAIHGWVFNTSSGKIIDLKLNNKELFDEMMETFKLK